MISLTIMAYYGTWSLKDIDLSNEDVYLFDSALQGSGKYGLDLKY